jgi:RNA polymerase sigma-70 factor (ECF subfamily)
MIDDEATILDLAGRAAGGDQGAWSELVRRHRPALIRTAAVLLRRPLLPRLDPEDVVQDALLDASRRLGEYLERRPLPFGAWLRQRLRDSIARAHRHHFQAGKRSPCREARSLNNTAAWSGPPASRLPGTVTTPSGRAARREAGDHLAESLARLKPADREVIQLTIFEGYDPAEAALILETTADAVRVRRGRALRRLAAWLPHGSPLDSR